MSATRQEPRSIPVARLRLGRIVATANAMEKLEPSDIQAAVARHQAGDWGEVDEDDRRVNDLALKENTRIHSVFMSASGVRFYLITDADRSRTHVLLPEDY